MRELSSRPGVRAGLLGGTIVVYLAVVGMIESFSSRPILTGIIEFGPLLVLLTYFAFGFFAGRPPREGSKPPPLLAGVTAGAIAGLVTAIFLIVVEVADAAGFNPRTMFVSINPAMRNELSFGFGAYAGAPVLVGLGALMGVLGGLTRSLSQRLRGFVFVGLAVVVGGALGGPLFRVMMDGLNIPSRWLFRSDALTLPGALILLLVTLGVRLYLQRSGGFRQVALTVPGASEKNLPIIGVLAAVILVSILPWAVNSFISDVLGTVGLYILLGLGLNIVVGFAGLLDLGYVAFYAVGAYTTAILTARTAFLVTDSPLQPAASGFTNFWVALPVTILVAVIIGVLIGAPVLRLRGDYLAIVTLGFGEIIRILVLSDWLKPIFGGPQGVTEADRVPFFGLNTRRPQILYYLIIGFALAAIYVATRLKESRIGRAWAAMREDEDIAEGMGVSVIKYKLLAFATGAAIGCLGGAFFAAKLSVANPGSFTLLVSINVLAVVVLGGMGSIRGVAVGSLVLVGLPELLREFGEFRLHIYGAIIIAIMILKPEGLLPDKRRAMELHAEEVPDVARGPLTTAAAAPEVVP
jgi:branched-chain amino acid transport system permease protein